MQDEALIARTQKFISATNSCLEGSPYQFPMDEKSLQVYTHIEESIMNIQNKLKKLVLITDLPQPLKNSLKIQEVYESNAIEGLGTDLASTANLIDGTSQEHKTSKSYIEWAVTRGIQNDAHLYDVIGLTAARELSRDISKIIDRPITAADIRAIHEIILKNQEYAGIYKLYPNRISLNNEHETTLPTDTPGQMNVFIDWFNTLSRRGHRTALSIVKAAAVHAWLTHIHPFHDGNGRLARLLANVVLAREDMPPLILRNTSHRGKYIDALSFSDSGGDISKLILVFCRAAERVIDDMENPRLAQEMFNEDINLRLQDEFKVWEISLNQFKTELEANLLLYNLNLTVSGGLSPSEYRSLRKGRNSGKPWWVEISNKKSEDIGVLYFGYLPGWAQTKLERDEHYPCLFFAPRDKNPKALRKYTKLLKEHNRKGFTHAILQPLEQKCYVWGETQSRLQKVTYQEAAKQIALTCSDFYLNPL